VTDAEAASCAGATQRERLRSELLSLSAVLKENLRLEERGRNFVGPLVQQLLSQVRTSANRIASLYGEAPHGPKETR